MSLPEVEISAVPTGGAAVLKMREYLVPPSGVTSLTIERSVSGASGLSPFVSIYSGAPVPVFLDIGDGLPEPLDSSAQYVWRVTDQRGATVTNPYVPEWRIATSPDQLTQIFIRLIQGAVNAMPVPDGYVRPQVTTQYPRNGWQAMPFIVVNLELIQQQEVAIGGDIPTPDTDNNWVFWMNAKRLWRVTIQCAGAEERDFYRDQLLAVFRVIQSTAFSPLGYNVRQSVQSVSYVDTDFMAGGTPGFYAADAMCEIDGILPITVLTDYGRIATVAATGTVTVPDYTTIELAVPSASGSI